MIRGWESIPGARRVLIEEGLTITNTNNGSPRVSGKLPGRDGDFEWRLLGLEQLITCSSVTTDSSPSVVWDIVRGWSPVTIGIDGWHESAYQEARGDAIRATQLTQIGRSLTRSAAMPASVTTGAMRLRYFYQFAYMVGTTWYDSAPRADLLASATFGRNDALASGDSYVADPVHDFYAWIAPCSKVNEVTIPFNLRSWASASDLEIQVPGADRIHIIGATDTDNAFVNTVTMTQLTIGGRSMLPTPLPINALVANWNRVCLPEGAAGADAITEITAATGAAASPEWLPIYISGGALGRNYLKQLTGAKGATAVFSADLGTTIHGFALRSWDPLPGSDVEARYISAISQRDRGFAPRERSASSKKDGHRPGLPYRLIG